MLKFLNAPSTSGIAALSEEINTALRSGQYVLWLVPGGSNIPITVAVMNRLDDSRIHQLTILQTDERFGPVGHPDENTKQLMDAGFTVRGATYIPILVTGLDQTATVDRYTKIVSEAFSDHAVRIGQFGIGADGHIAGSLPHSPAVSSDRPVVGYDAGEFSRITVTPSFLSQLTSAYAFVYGTAKQPTLTQLHDSQLPINDQPCQILHHIPTAYVYNDQIGETV
jgi:6-phosphogluconolactonase/glucosamine-6-phosphate isomerase/deaminase